MKTKSQYNGMLRLGYTTGACAAAAAKAATIVLLQKREVDRVQISLPGGQFASFVIKKCNFEKDKALCSVVKDAGDDPDVTDGVEIQAEARWIQETGILIKGGQGVGQVTKPGLEMPIGVPAINPVPKQMILQSIEEVIKDFHDIKGIEIIISVPRGKDLARRTLNSRLGIVGGISILGTTGIVIPYSVNAYTACISQALDVAAACGCREVVFTTGRRSEKFAQKELGLSEECFIQAGDYIGHSLSKCVGKGFTRVIIWGMIGKISKLASGHLYTNVSDSVVDINLLVNIAVECHVAEEIINKLKKAVTANHFRKMLPIEYLNEFCARLCLVAAVKCAEAVSDELEVECIVTDPEGEILGRENAKG